MERHIRAFGLELLFGYMGFLGVGWLYGRRWLVGLPLLLVWMPFLLAAIWGILHVGDLGFYPISTIASAIVLFPVYVAVPLLSAYGLRRRLTPPDQAARTPKKDAVG